MAGSTTRLGLRLPDPTDLVNVTSDINNSMSAIDAALGYEVATSLPASPYKGKAVAISTDGYRSYFNNGTSPASGGWIEILNSSGTFGSNVKLASGAQIVIGSDVNLFRNAANVLRTNDALIVDGATTLSSAVTVNSTLAVTGAVTVNSTLAVTGAVTLSSTLAVTGAITATAGVIGPVVSSISSTAITPLTSTSGTDTLITSVSVNFKSGFAYRIKYVFRFQVNGGTSPFGVYAKIKRLNASGTLIYDPGSTAGVTTNFMSLKGEVIVKCTAGNTTQTIALIGGFSGSGSPTSVDVEAATTAPIMLTVEMIGQASDFSGALEVPTA